jgi:hypothetical protein
MARVKDPEVEIKAKFKNSDNWKEYCKPKKYENYHNNGAGALYFVGFIGALIYWWQASVGIGAVVTGFLKACVWPAYIVYKLLESFYGTVL